MDKVIYKTEKYCYKIKNSDNINKSKIYIDHIKKHIDYYIQNGGNMENLKQMSISVDKLGESINYFIDEYKKVKNKNNVSEKEIEDYKKNNVQQKDINEELIKLRKSLEETRNSIK